MTPELYRYAADRGTLHWEVQQEITALKAAYHHDDPSHQHNQGGYPSLSW